MQDKPLAEKTRAQRHAWRFDDGTAVEMEWDRFRPSLGNSVVVTTGRAQTAFTAVPHARAKVAVHHGWCQSSSGQNCMKLKRCAVQIAEMLKVMMWHTPKGIIDEGGMMLDGYLNFNISLLAPPANNVMSVSLHAGARRQHPFLSVLLSSAAVCSKCAGAKRCCCCEEAAGWLAGCQALSVCTRRVLLETHTSASRLARRPSRPTAPTTCRTT